MMAPVYERLASQYTETVFLSVDTELEGNKPLAQSKGIRALPTFEIFAAKKPVRRIEGANAAELDRAIKEATDIAENALLEETMMLSALHEEELSTSIHGSSPALTHSDTRAASKGDLTLRVVASKNRSIRSITVSKQSTVKDLYSIVAKSCGCEVELLVWNKLVLDSRRRGKTLGELGMTTGSDIRIIVKQASLTIRLKVGESTTAVNLPPNGSVSLLRAKAREVTQTCEPKLIYLGRVLSPDTDHVLLRSLKIASDSTVLCQPAGAPWDPLQEQSRPPSSAPKEDIHEEESASRQFSNLCFIPPSPIWEKAEERFRSGTTPTSPEHLAAVHTAVRSIDIREAALTGEKIRLSETDAKKVRTGNTNSE